MVQHGYSDRIHHALAFCAKHHPGPVSRYDIHNPLLTTANVAVVLSRHGADETTIVAGILKQLVDASPQHRLGTLHANLACRFGGMVAAVVDAAAEPRFDVLGRERTWKACKFEALTRLVASPVRAADVAVATEIHFCGQALADIRRLGVEYARNVAPAPPLELMWWHRTLVETLNGRTERVTHSLLAELRALTAEVAAAMGNGSAPA